MESPYQRIKDEEDPSEPEINDKPTGGYCNATALHWVFYGLLVALILLLLVWNDEKRSVDDSTLPGFQRIYCGFTFRLYRQMFDVDVFIAPLWATVTYSPKVYDHANFESTGSSSPFKGLPRPELEEAWAGILNSKELHTDLYVYVLPDLIC
jgi:hypothetical protein